MNATTALLVDGAFLLIDDSLTAQWERDVVNSVLLARQVTARQPAHDADGYVNAFRGVLANIGWTSTHVTRISKSLDPARGAWAPLTLIAEELTGQLPDDLVRTLVARVAALDDAKPAARRAWTTTASDAGACASLLIVATLDDGVPVLVYDYNELTPAQIAGEYPWSEMTGPGTLIQLYGAAVVNPTVFTTEFSDGLAAKVAPLRPAAVVPLQP